MTIVVDVSKTSQMLDIPTRLIKQDYDIFSSFLCSNINTVLRNLILPEQLKYPGVKPVFKKSSRSAQKIMGQTVFCLTSPKYVKAVCVTSYMTILTHLTIFLSGKQCGFGKGFTVVNSLLPMTEKFRESLDQDGAYDALLTDQSKTFDCLRSRFSDITFAIIGIIVELQRILNMYHQLIISYYFL